MKVAIMSDSHDAIPNLEKAVMIAKEKGAEMIFHCGDLISPFMLPILAKFEKEVHLILGNNKGDVFLLCETLKKFPQIKLHGDQAFLKVKQFNIAMVHYPQIAYGLACTGDYDFVFFGHTHVYEVKEVGKTLMLNPGELLGKEGELVSFILLNLETKEFEKIEFPKTL